MKKAQVIGEVWATKKVPFLEGKKVVLLAIKEEEEAAGKDVQDTTQSVLGQRVVAAVDTMDAHQDEEVIVVFGSGARNVLKPGSESNLEVALDAAVAQIIDHGGR